MTQQQASARNRKGLSGQLPYYLFLRPLQVIARAVAPRQAALLGTAVGELLYRGVPRYRGVARRNLTAAFGWNADQTEAVARQACRNIGKTLVEFFQMPGWSATEVRRRCQLEGIEHLWTALDQGRGALVPTAHYGNWELFAARVVAEGIPLSVVAREADDA